MGLNINKVNLNILGSEHSLRFDFNFVNYKEKQEDCTSYYTFLDLYEIIDKEFVSLEDLDYINYVEIGDISKSGDINPNSLNLFDRNELNESYFKKIDKGDILRAYSGDILISSIRPNLKKLVLIDAESEKYYYTKALLQLRPKINSLVAYYLLRTVSFESINCVSRLGKGYPTLKVEDLKTITFDKKIIDRLLLNLNIPFIEASIKDIKLIQTSQEGEANIINEVLIEELGLNEKEFEGIKNTKTYSSKLADIGDNIDLRYSAKFHHPAHKYMLDFLKSKTTKRLKDFISEPIILGKTISPKQYEEDTDCYYMSMATIKSWYFDSTEAKQVSLAYEKDNLDKKVVENDIVIARSGEGSIGKVALITDLDTNAVFADFTIRVRLINYNQQFAYYYFRSLFFQHLVEHNKKGLGNNTNIFPSQISEFPMPDYSLEDQERIVKKIKDRINEQQKYTIQVEEKRAEIEKLILDTLSKQ